LGWLLGQGAIFGILSRNNQQSARLSPLTGMRRAVQPALGGCDNEEV